MPSGVVGVPQDLETREFKLRIGRCVRTISYLTRWARGKRVAVTREEKKRATMNPGATIVGTAWAVATRESEDFIATSNAPTWMGSWGIHARKCNETDEPITTW